MSNYDEYEDKYQLWLEQHEDDYYCYDFDESFDDSYDEPYDESFEEPYEELFEEPFQEFDISEYSEPCQNFIMNWFK